LTFAQILARRQCDCLCGTEDILTQKRDMSGSQIPFPKRKISLVAVYIISVFTCVRFNSCFPNRAIDRPQRQLRLGRRGFCSLGPERQAEPQRLTQLIILPNSLQIIVTGRRADARGVKAADAE
jgi:hypothetical protein